MGKITETNIERISPYDMVERFGDTITLIQSNIIQECTDTIIQNIDFEVSECTSVIHNVVFDDDKLKLYRESNIRQAIIFKDIKIKYNGFYGFIKNILFTNTISLAFDIMSKITDMDGFKIIISVSRYLNHHLDLDYHNKEVISRFFPYCSLLYRNRLTGNIDSLKAEILSYLSKRPYKNDLNGKIII